MLPRRSSLRFLFLAVMLLVTCLNGNAALAFIFVRDAEIESTLHDYINPILQAGGLNPASVRLFLIHDTQLNAFVAGGQNIFVFTGLILAAEDPTEVIGVLAHEAGHISGGHLARTGDAIDRAQTIGILSSVLGVGAALIAGRGDVATAAIATGQDVANRSFLSFSRTQESSADQAALRLLEATGQSARGLARFLSVLQDQELLSTANQDPYVRTHPLSRDRIETIEAFLKTSKYTDAPVDPALQARHDRIRAKIYAYSFPFRTVMKTYPESDQSIAGRYARAFAYYRKHDMATAHEKIDALIADMPEDPYFEELKAQMLFESGDAAAAVPHYQRAVDLSPRSALLLGSLGRAQIATEDPAMLPLAEKNLQASLAFDRRSPSTWRQLAIAYGRQDKLDLSSLALAEEAMLKNEISRAKHHAGKVADAFPVGSPEWLQAQDILNAVDVKTAE